MCRTALEKFHPQSTRDRADDTSDGQEREQVSKWASRLLGLLNDFQHRTEEERRRSSYLEERRVVAEVAKAAKATKRVMADGVAEAVGAAYGEEEEEEEEEGVVCEYDAWEEILAMSVATDRTTNSVRSGGGSTGEYAETIRSRNVLEGESGKKTEEEEEEEEEEVAVTTTTMTTPRLRKEAITSRSSAKKRSISAFSCPITQSVMVDPATTSDGMTYEREAIERWLTEHDTSPLTGIVLPHKFLTPNYALRSAIEDWKATEEDEREERSGRAMWRDGDGEEEEDDDDDAVMRERNGVDDARTTTRLDFMNRRKHSVCFYIYIYIFFFFSILYKYYLLLCAFFYSFFKLLTNSFFTLHSLPPFLLFPFSLSHSSPPLPPPKRYMCTGMIHILKIIFKVIFKILKIMRMKSQQKSTMHSVA